MYDRTNITRRLDLRWRASVIAVCVLGAVIGIMQMRRTAAMYHANAALRAAVRTGNVAEVRAALNKGAYSDEPAYYHDTIDELGMSMSHSRESQYTVLNMASGNGSVPMAKALLDACPTPPLRKVRATAALFDAGTGDMVHLLVSYHADVNARGPSGETPIFVTFGEKPPEVTIALIACGANPNARDSYGRTVLMLAAEYSDAKLVAALIAGGADPAIRDKDGLDAMARLHALMARLRASYGYQHNLQALAPIEQLLRKAAQRAAPGR